MSRRLRVVAPPDAASSDAELLLEDLAVLTAELADVEARRTALYAQRICLLERGQAMMVRQRSMASVCNVTEVAITQALKKERERREATV